jgi:hypothetical protein
MSLFRKTELPRLQRWAAAAQVALVYRTSIVGRHGPIRIVSISLENQEAAFVACVEKALLLIGSVHPRGYRRIRREFCYIADIPIAAFGSCYYPTRTCKINFCRVKKYASLQPEEWGVALLACILIHEATHARLHSMGLPYDATTWVGIERLCKREEERFAARLPGDTYDPKTLVFPFDEATYAADWNRSRWQRMGKELRALRQAIREIRNQKS